MRLGDAHMANPGMYAPPTLQLSCSNLLHEVLIAIWQGLLELVQGVGCDFDLPLQHVGLDPEIGQDVQVSLAAALQPRQLLANLVDAGIPLVDFIEKPLYGFKRGSSLRHHTLTTSTAAGNTQR